VHVRKKDIEMKGRPLLEVSPRGVKRLVDQESTLNKIERADIWHSEDPMHGIDHKEYMRREAKKDGKHKSHKAAPKRRATKGKNKVEKVMREYKEGKLHSGSKKGPKVTSRKQAIAIGLSEARRAKKKR